jgi:hypothetical protein
MSNWRFESAKSTAYRLKGLIKDKEHKQRLQDIIDDINAGIYINDKRFSEQEMWAICNPGFPGDMIGRPDDDFPDDDEDDEK